MSPERRNERASGGKPVFQALLQTASDDAVWQRRQAVGRDGVVSLSTEARRSVAVSSWSGLLPDSISCGSAPKKKGSDRASRASPRACSGDV
jgi:hypothetical protein